MFTYICLKKVNFLKFKIDAYSSEYNYLTLVI